MIAMPADVHQLALDAVREPAAAGLADDARHAHHARPPSPPRSRSGRGRRGTPPGARAASASTRCRRRTPPPAARTAACAPPGAAWGQSRPGVRARFFLVLLYRALTPISQCSARFARINHNDDGTIQTTPITPSTRNAVRQPNASIRSCASGTTSTIPTPTPGADDADREPEPVLELALHVHQRRHPAARRHRDRGEHAEAEIELQRRGDEAVGEAARAPSPRRRTAITRSGRKRAHSAPTSGFTAAVHQREHRERARQHRAAPAELREQRHQDDAVGVPDAVGDRERQRDHAEGSVPSALAHRRRSLAACGLRAGSPRLQSLRKPSVRPSSARKLFVRTCCTDRRLEAESRGRKCRQALRPAPCHPTVSLSSPSNVSALS